MTVRTRFAPSPTGLIHLGNTRTALFNVLFAAKHQGAFILRIEDTDQTRSHNQFVDALQEDLKWLDIDWQEGPIFQSERAAVYEKYYTQLANQQCIYPCFCSDHALMLMRKMQLAQGIAPRYAGTCKTLTPEEIAKHQAEGKKPAWRFSVPPNQKILFTDLVKGEQIFNSNEIGDFIIRRQDGTAPFLFCNAIDDIEMNVSHVFRGEDHLTNTSRQVLILQTLGLPIPLYGHFALIVSQKGSPLSKRQGDMSIQEMRKKGYLPEGIVNYLARLGHAMADSQQLLSLSALALSFEPKHLSSSPSAFDEVQLMHWQKTAVQALSPSRALQWLGEERVQQIPKDKLTDFSNMVTSNFVFPEDADIWIAVFFNDSLALDDVSLQTIREAGSNFFATAMQVIETYDANWQTTLQTLQQTLQLQGKKLFMPLRAALTGQLHGPGLQDIAFLLGKEKMLRRLEVARERALSA